jgi:hypothetical protein
LTSVMGKNNFNNSLSVPKASPREAGKPPGPLARGPVAEGDEMTWIQVWIFQNPRRGRRAAATGTSKWGQRFTKTWRVDTERVDGSDAFSPGKPAMASAMALVERSDGAREVDWWSEAITIAK